MTSLKVYFIHTHKVYFTEKKPFTKKMNSHAQQEAYLDYYFNWEQNTLLKKKHFGSPKCYGDVSLKDFLIRK